MTVTFVEQQGAGAIKDSVRDGAYKVVLIRPGQGSSAYYTEDLIKTHAPTAFPKGTHVYLDHLKDGESRTPERLIGTLSEDTEIDDLGQAVNYLRPLSKHREWVEEIRHFVGLSISAKGEGRKGEVDGKEVLIAEALIPHVTNTVDIVSYAGAGGKFLESLLDDANDGDGQSNSTQTDLSGVTKGNESMTITAEQATALIESVAALDAKIDAVAAERISAEESQTEADARIASAIEATRLVENAEIADSYKEELRGAIAAGNYDVKELIEKRAADEATLREELRTEFEALGFRESVGASASGGSAPSPTDSITVKGW